ncbi:hypothetical protein [Flavobacterium sp. UGB4466]|uniref:hypothetical protein n=1 Tax=Flavobacterium sp. UGB4466 TaxID=2730889 RepID=UPI00192B2428|nr:hypothetical protein [Flavobacterium sp. UGB4466]
MKDQENLGTYPVKTDGDDGAAINTVFSQLRSNNTTFNGKPYDASIANVTFANFYMQFFDAQGHVQGLTYYYNGDSGLWNQNGDTTYPVYNDQVSGAIDIDFSSN